MSIREVSRVIARCVDSKVGMLQSGYLASRASSRASLARLRRLDTAGEGILDECGRGALLPIFLISASGRKLSVRSWKACGPLFSYTPFSSSQERAPLRRFPLMAERRIFWERLPTLRCS